MEVVDVVVFLYEIVVVVVACDCGSCCTCEKSERSGVEV